MILQWIFILGIILLVVVIWWQLFFRNKKNIAYDIPNLWRRILAEKVSFYHKLSDPDKFRFEQAIMVFLNDVVITGVETKIDDTDRILVASSAIIPLFGFPGWRYRNIKEVLLYRDQFNADYETEGKDNNILGMVGSGAMNRIMILSKPALHEGFMNQSGKSNVGIHEFVHLLDKADGSSDGVPESLLEKQFVIPWLNYMHQEIENIKKRKSDINPYGATSTVEFFSVASEYFFKKPEQFAIKHPELYEIMTKIYRQDS